MKNKIGILLSMLLTFIIFMESAGAYGNTFDSPPSPSKAMEGPVFPFEELIEKPTPATDRFLSDLFNMLATLGIIIVIILIAGWFLKRLNTSRQQQANISSCIKILERRALSPKTALYLLEIEGTGILLAESANGVTRLSEFPITADVKFTSVLDSK